ncbi:hypothetical protein [Sphingobacterium sp. IITKGP-BTPF85]|uniref:hypothetical protein n=1 Tax=Sphingobacterium sp. IITKGP-BTPF85 TaxID=1338009 RepID=UPI0003F66F37|nr:hypothetical protein [Sphingobacterium sp. IITKGP-BTPF85]KKX51990.1 hypothetical protein L950_0202245 [Sphingobacterium sp. IITKGP-BTPF85]
MSISILSLSLSTPSFAQQISNYSYTEAFAPLFFNNNGDEFRSASGKPGPAYWQNNADYKITATLDDRKNTIAGNVEINYSNNSPDQLDYVWLQLDQNMFSKEGRGKAISPLTKSRYGDANASLMVAIRYLLSPI